MNKIEYIKVKTYEETVPQSKFEIRFNYIRNNQMEEKEIGILIRQECLFDKLV